jgi:DNA polymerase
MQPLVDAWRAANPHIVRFWNALGNAASEVIERQNSVRVGKVTVYRKEGHLLIRLPGGRDLCYLSPRFVRTCSSGRSTEARMVRPASRISSAATEGGFWGWK